MMFDGISPKTLLNTPEEWHCLLIGFFEVLCPWPARYEKCDSCCTSLKGEVLCPWPSRYHLTMKPMGELLKEYHYYMAGRGVGFVALLLTLWGIITLIKEALI